MSELLRYEELIKGQLSDLPLPDENFAWAEMKKLLDEEEDDGIIVPPVKWGCGPGTLFLILLITGACWLFIRPEKWLTALTSNKKDIVTNNTSNKERDESSTGAISLPPDSLKANDSNNISKSVADPRPSRKPATTRPNDLPVNKTGTNPSQNKKSNTAGKKHIAPSHTQSDIISIDMQQKPRKKNRIIKKRDPKKVNQKIPGTQIAPKDLPDNKFNNSNINRDSIISKQNASGTGSDSSLNMIAKKDSLKTAKKDSLPIADTTNKTKKEKIISYSWGAGLAIYQQLPFDGQKAVPYNSLGREGSLMDYIPAVYLRYYKDKKWFIQSEFRYAAPQYTKDITYDIKKNTGPSGNVDSALKVKKTYYHQIPLSFNFYVVPGLTIGTGFVFNKFKSAISQQEVFKTFTGGQADSTISSTIVKTSTKNSAFSKSYFQLLAETQYTWKRITIGAKYARGLQPYLKFQLPGEPLKEEKNSSLQVFLRYELWKLKSKSAKVKKDK